VTTRSIVQGVAAHGLPGHEGPQLPGRGGSGPLGPGPWSSLIHVVQAQRLVGFLHAAVEAGALPVTDDQRREVEDLHLSWCGRVLRLERILLDVAAELERAEIRFLVLKGSASAHLVHRDPALRLFGDNDLLFRSESFSAALTVLQGLGYRRGVSTTDAMFDRRFGKGVTLRGPAGDEIDAHRTLVFGTFGFAIDLDELFDSAVPLELGGRQLRALGPETRLLHACYHAALGDPVPRFSSVRDVAEMLIRGPHDPSRVLELAERWQARAVVARAVALCQEHLRVEVDGPLVDELADYQPTPRERRAIDSYVGPERGFAAKVTTSLPYLDRTTDKVAFLGASVVRSAVFSAPHGLRSTIGWFRRGVRSLVRGSGRGG
jgi:hypothetical protein